VLDALTQQIPTFTQERLAHVLRRYIEDAAARAALAETICMHADVVALADDPGGGVTRYTTRRVLAEEQHALAAAAMLAGNRGYGLEARGWAEARGATRLAQLSAEQKEAVTAATGYTGLAIIWGQAGTGKSFVLNAARACYEAGGYRVIGLAPTNAVAADLNSAGFSRTATIHAELYALEKGRRSWNAKTVVMVDEAAMIDSALMGQLLHHAQRAGAKMILAGDDRQFASIARGGLFSVLKERYGAATLTKVRRQLRDDDRRASELMAEGEFETALNLYEGQGALCWTDSQAAARGALIEAWAEDRAAHPEATQLVLAYTNAEVAKLNAALRAVCKRRGELGADYTFATAHGRLAFARGDRIQFTGTAKPLGIVNGSAGRITELHGDKITVSLDSGATLRFDAAGFTKFQHGYASTLHRSQGRSHDRTYLFYSKHWRAASSYVALTRHRDAMRLFVNRDLAHDLTALVRQMKREDERRAASLFHPVARVPAGIEVPEGDVPPHDANDGARRARPFDPHTMHEEPSPHEAGDAAWRRPEPRADAGDGRGRSETVALENNRAEEKGREAGRREDGFVRAETTIRAAAREGVVAPSAPNVTPDPAMSLSRTPANARENAARIKTHFRAAAREAAEPAPAPPAKKTRRGRSGGDHPPGLARPALVDHARAAARPSAARGRYAGLMATPPASRANAVSPGDAGWMNTHAACDPSDDTLAWLGLWEDNAAFDYGMHDDYSWSQSNHLFPTL
jgi:hypothetical protein